ncbi:hypothetical protein Rsub_12572 [Raphidocelis subcapitata]|uniref:ABCF3 PWI-like helical bundle domain-containing protein n=1 Tax=Raphidocelis subcapitata TaxID=307507 RepID=A0A2V0PJV3_9CHLO|nr:hypothetical protein Rsub_12572 [Raphidocelis subcapitata]|eukprot:GBF99819.1 hypothetical protein Rsub_12572 [Raphidocelis subcapitata]
MVDESEVRAVVHDVLGAHSDSDILEYVVGVLHDEHFDWGEAFEQLGGLLVDSGCCANDDGAKAACEQLAQRLDPGRTHVSPEG